MKRTALLVLLVIVVMVASVGVVAADPGPRNPYRDVITNVNCEGETHDYEMLYTVGLSPWFDPDGSTVAAGPTRVEMEVDGQWVLRFELPGKGVPTTFCTWTRGETHFRGDVQFAPPH